MRRPGLIIAVVGALACVTAGCTFFMGRTVATSAGAGAAPAAPAAATNVSHEQLCSQLRADIASGQHNQRSAPPASNTSIIAAASEGKVDQKVAPPRPLPESTPASTASAARPARWPTTRNIAGWH
jgi:hypothetical protein